MGISLLQIGGQLIIVFFGGHAFSTVHLSKVQWGISIVFGAISLIFGVLIRLIPDESLERCIPNSLKRRVEAYFRKREHIDEEAMP
jgi:Ca2+-transporting ATPase